jgi:hypothetical protein
MGQPELAEDHEAQHIGAQRRQDLVDRPGEVGAVQARRHLQVEGEQGDGDGEDRVAGLTIAAGGVTARDPLPV